MSRLPDLVVDSQLDTTFRDSSTIHTYREIDEAGHRYYRQETWDWGHALGHGSYGQVRLQKCTSEGTNQHSLRAVKMIFKPPRSLPQVDLTRELEAIAKFSKSRVSTCVRVRASVETKKALSTGYGLYNRSAGMKTRSHGLSPWSTVATEIFIHFFVQSKTGT
jgi:hypothetical protein